MSIQIYFIGFLYIRFRQNLQFFNSFSCDFYTSSSVTSAVTLLQISHVFTFMALHRFRFISFYFFLIFLLFFHVFLLHFDFAATKLGYKSLKFVSFFFNTHVYNLFFGFVFCNFFSQFVFTLVLKGEETKKHSWLQWVSLSQLNFLFLNAYQLYM